MADSIPGEIWIGGDVPISLVPKLLHAIEEDGQSFDDAKETLWGPHNDPRSYLNEKGLLHFVDGSARNGEFPSIEAFCQKHHISYDRTSEAYLEFDGEVVRYRPGMEEPVAKSATQAGEDYVTRSDLEGVLKLLEAGKADEAKTKLAELLWLPDELPEFRIVEKRRRWRKEKR